MCSTRILRTPRAYLTWYVLHMLQAHTLGFPLHMQTFLHSVLPTHALSANWLRAHTREFRAPVACSCFALRFPCLSLFAFFSRKNVELEKRGEWVKEAFRVGVVWSGCVFTLSTHTSYSIVFSKKNPAREKSKRNLPQRVCLTIKFHRHARGQLCCSCTRSSVCAPHTYVCRFVLCPHACAAPCSIRTLVQIYVPSLHSYCLFTRTHIHTHTHIYIYIYI